MCLSMDAWMEYQTVKVHNDWLLPITSSMKVARHVSVPWGMLFWCTTISFRSWACGPLLIYLALIIPFHSKPP